MLELWAQGLETARLLIQIQKTARKVQHEPTNMLQRMKYRVLARELSARGHTFPVYPTLSEVIEITRILQE